MIAHIRSQRLKLGYTQVQLSVLSGVSLPTIQNIEAGKGNPSYEVLQSLMETLGFTVVPTLREANWNYLIQIGLPLSGTTNQKIQFNDSEFIREIKQACLQVSETKRTPDHRLTEALVAFLFAIKNHFPSWFQQHLEGVPIIESMLTATPSGRMIKLSRQAVDSLSHFL